MDPFTKHEKLEEVHLLIESEMVRGVFANLADAEEAQAKIKWHVFTIRTLPLLDSYEEFEVVLNEKLRQSALNKLTHKDKELLGLVPPKGGR